MFTRFPARVCTRLLLVVFVLACTLTVGAPAQVTPARSHDASIVIVIDTSHEGRPLNTDLRPAINSFLQLLNEEDEVALVGANERPKLLQDFTSDTAQIQNQLTKMKTSGTLALVDAVAFAAKHAAEDATTDNPAVVVFTANHDVRRVDVRNAIRQTSNGKAVPVYLIAAPYSDWKLQEEVQKIASVTGGVAFFPAPSELREVVQATALRVAGPPEEQSQEARTDHEGLLRNYSTLLVRDIPFVKSDATTEAEGGENKLLQQVVMDRLREARLFPKVIDATGMSESSVESTQPRGTAELLASILEYRRGNRAQRQLLGWKGGAKVKVRVIMVDAATRQPIFSFTEEGTHSSGLLGGTQEHVQSQAMLEVANGIVKELKRAKQPDTLQSKE